MYTPHHHPEEPLLMSYSAGGLHEAGSLIVATHLSLCNTCRTIVSQMEALGGALLADMPTMDLSAGALDAVLARLDSPEPAPTVPPLPRATDGFGLPGPLGDYLGGAFTDLNWNKRMGGVQEFDIAPASGPDMRCFLVQLGRGMKIPKHTHTGCEMTLVLTGAFTDKLGTFAPGDFVELNGETEHQPHIHEDAECICLAVTSGPVKLTSWLGRLMNPFLKL